VGGGVAGRGGVQECADANGEYNLGKKGCLQQGKKLGLKTAPLWEASITEKIKKGRNRKKRIEGGKKVPTRRISGAPTFLGKEVWTVQRNSRQCTPPFLIVEELRPYNCPKFEKWEKKSWTKDGKKRHLGGEGGKRWKGVDRLVQGKITHSGH